MIIAKVSSKQLTFFLFFCIIIIEAIGRLDTMITEFGEFEFEVGEEQRVFPIYNFTREPSNDYSFNIKMDNKWVNIYYWNSTETPKWLWTTKYDKKAHEWHYELFPYKVIKFYYNTTLETM